MFYNWYESKKNYVSLDDKDCGFHVICLSDITFIYPCSEQKEFTIGFHNGQHLTVKTNDANKMIKSIWGMFEESKNDKS
jgi:hypothetical protein